jgi:hypothetical protein
MSYVLDFTADARAAWLALDIDVQELVLDELDQLAAKAVQRSRWVHDMTVERSGMKHYLFLDVRAFATTQTLRVYRVGHFSRSA